MTNTTTATKAVIFIPPDIAEDGLYTRQALMHIERRGYELACLPLRAWDQVLHVLRAGLATVIVLARRDHFDPTFEPRLEVVGEETQRLCAPKDGNDRRNRFLFGAGSRSRRPRIIN